MIFRHTFMPLQYFLVVYKKKYTWLKLQVKSCKILNILLKYMNSHSKKIQMHFFYFIAFYLIHIFGI